KDNLFVCLLEAGARFCSNIRSQEKRRYRRELFGVRMGRFFFLAQLAALLGGIVGATHVSAQTMPDPNYSFRLTTFYRGEWDGLEVVGRGDAYLRASDRTWK